MDIHELRSLAGREEIDYSFLINALSKYRQPRMKINAFLNTGSLIRVKKGLYVFGEKVRRSPFCKEELANLIYGPSAISLEYALSYYGLIPERVEVLTCITNNRYKQFHTPIGTFEYFYLTPKKYTFGIHQITVSATQRFLIVIKEKALADQLMLKTPKLNTTGEIHSHIIENLRIDELSLKQLNMNNIKKLANLYKNKNIDLLLQLIGTL